MQVERRTGKVRRPKTDVLPLCHVRHQPKNLQSFAIWLLDLADRVRMSQPGDKARVTGPLSAG